MSKNKSSIAIDYGTKKSWLAYSVESFAFSYKTVKTRDLIEEVTELIASKNPEILVIGMPYHIDGSLSKQARKVESFAKICEKHFPTLRIVLHDERLTTSEARLGMQDVEDADIDAESARLILEDYLVDWD